MSVIKKCYFLIIVLLGVFCHAQNDPMVLSINFSQTSFPWAFDGASSYEYTVKKVGQSTESAVKTATNELKVDEIGEYWVSIKPPASKVAISKEVIDYDIRDQGYNILELKNWGDIEWSSMAYLFSGSSSLVISATDVPNVANCNSFSHLFNRCEELTEVPNISDWNTSNVTNMSYMFSGAGMFNQDLSFDTSNVTDMSNMFNGAISFNQPIIFNTGNVTNMSVMFRGASPFNQPLSFDTSKVTNMSSMFSGLSSFNQPLSFDTSKVTNMSYMFYRASYFNQPLSFDTRNVETMGSMFAETRVFNQPLNFDTRNVESMETMFGETRVFNQPLSFDTRKVTNMANMFRSASSFNQDLGHLQLNPNVSLSWFADNSGIDCVNYSKTLKGWASNSNVPSNRTVRFGNKIRTSR